MMEYVVTVLSVLTAVAMFMLCVLLRDNAKQTKDMMTKLLAVALAADESARKALATRLMMSLKEPAPRPKPVPPPVPQSGLGIVEGEDLD